MKAKVRKILLHIAYPLIVVALVVLIWQIAAAAIGVTLVVPRLFV